VDELHLEGELYLGFASFAYYVKTKYGYNLFRSGSDHLVLTGDGVCFYFELTLQCPHVECGYVYVNSYDWGNIFGENLDLGKSLSEECWRRKGNLFYGEKDWHCHLDDSLKGNIKTTLNNGYEVICKYIHKSK